MESTRTRFATSLTVLLLLGCRSGSPVAERTASGMDSANASSAAPAGTVPSSHSVTTNGVNIGKSSASEETVARGQLPRLEPVLKQPFPDGATDEQVCAAIANTSEKDLWRRFGHLVPLYMPGSLLIVDAPASQQAKVEAFIGAYYGGAYFPLVKACSHGKLMAYVRGLKGYEPMDDREPGLPHLARQIKQALGTAVTEYFGYFNDQQRLSDYCRADGELCEQLVKLDYRNSGLGMCPSALSLVGLFEGSSSYKTTLKRCEGIARESVACAWYSAATASQEECRAKLRRLLLP